MKASAYLLLIVLAIYPHYAAGAQDDPEQPIGAKPREYLQYLPLVGGGVHKFFYYGECDHLTPCEPMVIDPQFILDAHPGRSFYAVWVYFIDPYYGDSAILFPAITGGGCLSDSAGNLLYCGWFNLDRTHFEYQRVAAYPAYMAATDEISGQLKER